MGPNGCGCSGNGNTSSYPSTFDLLANMQKWAVGSVGVGNGSFLLTSTAVDLSALRSAPMLGGSIPITGSDARLSTDLPDFSIS